MGVDYVRINMIEIKITCKYKKYQKIRNHTKENKKHRFKVVHPIPRLHPPTISSILLLSSDCNPQSLTT